MSVAKRKAHGKKEHLPGDVWLKGGFTVLNVSNNQTELYGNQIITMVTDRFGADKR